ncbi:family 43 glycosylhydrolase, partial [candidate division KSB1 bacterium]|nr:family 43 glycosylhydrolase [candidate division KSB1 bacterium]
AQNPIVPPGMYIADPAAHVWDDGKLYIYGSVDESPDYYCSWRHHVMVTEDMKTWTIHENRFTSKGEGDGVPYSDKLLFAPDVMVKDGKFYMYFCQPDLEFTEGVAVSDSPTGPFKDGKPIDLGGYPQIDPAVFIDDDGQAYYIWGQFTAKMAKLKPNMMELDKSSIRDSVLTESEHFFHEGGFLTKHNGLYYFIYAHMGRATMPTCIGYATSTSPMGPYRYGGVIVDNDHCDPGNWNNHGSIAEFNGQWYVFYHRATHNSKMMRKACVEPIYFNEDGSIDEVEMTSQGAGEPLDCRAKIDAERACLLLGNIRIQAFSSDEEELGGIHDQDRAAYKYINFGNGVESVTIRVRPGKNPTTIDLVADMPWYRGFGRVNVPAGEKTGEWITLTEKVQSIDGVRALWLMFYGEGWDLCEVDWFRFE